MSRAVAGVSPCPPPEGVSLVALLQGLQQPPVEAQADGDGEQGQRQVRRHGDGAEGGQGQQQQEAGAREQPRPPGVAPQQQLAGWGDTAGRGGTRGDAGAPGRLPPARAGPWAGTAAGTRAGLGGQLINSPPFVSNPRLTPFPH